MEEEPLSRNYGAIGSERKTTRPVQPAPSSGSRGHTRRPSSWQDEIGQTKPNIPKQIGNLEPFDIENPPPPAKYTRSTSFPEFASPIPPARLTQTRSLGQPLGYDTSFATRARDLGQMGLIPPSTQEEDFTVSGSKPDLSFYPLLKSPNEFVPSTSMHPPFSPTSSDLDSLSQSVDSISLRDSHVRSSQNKAAYSMHRPTSQQQPSPNDAVGGRELTTPSPTFGAPDVDWETYKRIAPYPRRQLSARVQELLSSPTTRESVARRSMLLLRMRTPQTIEQQRQAQLSEIEMACLRLRDEVRLSVPDSEYPFLNGGGPNFNLSEYPIEIQKAILNPQPRPESVYIVVVFKLHRAAIYYRPEDMVFTSEIKSGDMIVVQADRGEDVGFVWKVTANVLEAEEMARHLNTEHLRNLLSFVKLYTGAATRLARYQLPVNYGQDLVFKSIVRKAGGPEAKRLLDKEHDETKAKRIAEQKARERGLPMEILDAEFQADHGKLTIYYISEQYIVFKEFVDDMYKVYKMRVWMSSVNQVRPSR